MRHGSYYFSGGLKFQTISKKKSERTYAVAEESEDDTESACETQTTTKDSEEFWHLSGQLCVRPQVRIPPMDSEILP